MPSEYTFPDTMLDPDFRDSFLGDLQQVQTQLTSALRHDQATGNASASTMKEVLSAMHMLRGAAGAINHTLAFDYSELFHRLAEIGHSFYGGLKEDFEKVYHYLKEAEALLEVVRLETEAGEFKDSVAMYSALEKRVSQDFGDYFYDTSLELDDDLPKAAEPDADDTGDLDSFLSMVNEGIPDGEATDSDQGDIVGLGGDAPAEWDVLQYFYQEADENLSGLEQAFLAMEKGKSDAKAEVLRLAHSTKGAANSMGMFRIGKLMHALEDLFERVDRDTLTLSQQDYSQILMTGDIIRSILTETQQRKPIEGLQDKLIAHMSGLQSLGSVAAPSNEVAEEKVAEGEEPRTEDFEDEALLANATANTFRIDADKIDSLLNVVGELILSRTRMSKKIEELLGFCGELSKSRSRMRGALGAFSERFDYSENERRRRISERPLTSDGAEEEFGFGSMEFDRYDEYNILSRQIAEIGDDTDLAIREILRGGQDVRQEAQSLGGYISQIQDEIANTRLAPIVVLFKRLERAVRDAALKAGHEVVLITSGDDLLIDKSILDDLFNPMLHIVRNCVAHAFGTNSAVEKQIIIQARQEGGRILIRVGDNGDGIDFKRVQEIGIERGLLGDSHKPDEAELISMIFQPGFSTAATTGEVSGRGIGLDAVQATIEGFGGSISVASQVGKGTTFSLHLPLTLAIDRGMYFYVGERIYAIFMAAVEQVYFSRDLSFKQTGERELVLIGEETVPVLDLRQVFEEPIQPDNRRESIILCRYLNRRVALKVDRVFYQDDVVVKSLGDLFEGHRFFSSATINGDGEVVPILDISRLDRSSDAEVGGQVGGLIEEAPLEQTPRILVVDDSLSVRKVCEGYLSGTGNEVVTAVDGLDALNKLKAESFDLILSDLEMPRLNGLDLLSELKRRPATSGIPVVIVTSRTTAKHQKKAIELGAAKCLGKPFTKEQLVGLVEEQLVARV